MYYKFPLLLIVGGIAVLLYFIHAGITQKEPVFTAYLFDAHTDMDKEAVEGAFAGFAGIDAQETVTVDTSFLLADPSAGNYAMVSLARFYTDIGTENLDACMMLEDNFMAYADSDAFLDLRTCLSGEQMEIYAEELVYAGDVPVGIQGNDMKWVLDSESYEGDACVFGILYNSRHVENAVKFLEFLNEA